MAQQLHYEIGTAQFHMQISHDQALQISSTLLRPIRAINEVPNRTTQSYMYSLIVIYVDFSDLISNGKC